MSEVDRLRRTSKPASSLAAIPGKELECGTPTWNKQYMCDSDEETRDSSDDEYESNYELQVRRLKKADA